MPTLEVWMSSPFVECKVDFEETQDIDINENLISWFDVKFKLPETEEEKKEKIEAIKSQIEYGVLDKHGIPPGVEFPESLKQQLLAQQTSKMISNNKKHIPTIKQNKVNKQMILSPLARQIEKQLRKNRKGN